MSATRDLFVATAEACVVMVDAPEFEARWSMPSVLAEMSVGALGAHLLRAVSTARHYLEGDAGEGPEVDAAQYYLAAGVTPDLESDLNRAVRERASADADSASGVRQRAGDLLDWARGDLTGLGERRVQVFGGFVIGLDDYLVTRMVEMLVHGDDLALSLGLPTPRWDERAVDLVVATLVEVARRRHGDVAVLRALTRRERDAIHALRVL